MFIHLLFGGLIFLFLGNHFGFEVNKTFILTGAFMGIFPDILSYVFSFKSLQKLKTKNAHAHRDNFSHSIFFPLLIIIYALVFSDDFIFLSGLAMLTHPFLDLYGIGWGVKLFYPFSLRTYKLFHDGKFLHVWKEQKEIDDIVNARNDNNWIKGIYFKFSIYSLLEWLIFLVVLLLIFMN